MSPTSRSDATRAGSKIDSRSRCARRWDLDAILHPQTLLVLRQLGEPLDQAHGAPLRLATPNKYGIKTIKRIGIIRYSRERPPDYWAERSYDWYAEL